MIRKILIENFRSIKSIQLDATGLNGFVGPNNSGKSNILRAIDLILGPKWPPYTLAREQKHHDLPGAPTVIQVEFDSPLTKDYYGNLHAVWGLKLADEPPEGPEFYCLDVGGQVIRVGRYNNPLRPDNELRDQMPALLVEVNRDLEPELRASQWTILGKILGSIEAKLRSDPEFVKGYDEKAANLSLHLHQESVRELRGLLNDELRGMSGFDSLEIAFDPPSVLGSLRSLRIMVREGAEFPFADAEELGQGLQSALVVALARSFQKLCQGSTRPVLLMEEPEVYLHPQARRAFFALLDRTSVEEGCQVFYTTHSTEFVDITRPELLTAVRKSKRNGTEVVQGRTDVITPDARAELKLACEFDSNLRQTLFATCVIACEGDSELVSIPSLLEKAGFSVDTMGVVVVSTGSKTNLPHLLRICRHFGIPTVAVFDDDSEALDFASYVAPLNQEITDLSGGPSQCWVSTPNYDRSQKIPPGESKRRAALKWARSLPASQAALRVGPLLDALRVAMGQKEEMTGNGSPKAV